MNIVTLGLPAAWPRQSKMVAILDPVSAGPVLIIRTVAASHTGFVTMRTVLLGTDRIVDILARDQSPRTC